MPPPSLTTVPSLGSLLLTGALTAGGLVLSIAVPTLFPFASGLFSAGIAYFLHSYLGGLEQGALDIDSSSDSTFNKVARLAVKAKVSGPVVVFFLIWGLLLGMEAIQRQDRDTAEKLRELIPRPETNQLQIIPDTPAEAGDVRFRIRMNGADLGVIDRTTLIDSLQRLAATTARQRNSNRMTQQILLDCASIKGVCEQPSSQKVMVSFQDHLGPNRAQVCPESPILAKARITGYDILLSRSFNRPSTLVEVEAGKLDAYAGPSPCQEEPNWVQIDMRYRPIFGPDREGLTEGYLYTVQRRVER